MTDNKLSALLESLRPILDAVEINDGDTLSSLSQDREVIWTATGCWGGGAQITLGDLRRIAAAARKGKES